MKQTNYFILGLIKKLIWSSTHITLLSNYDSFILNINLNIIKCSPRHFSAGTYVTTLRLLRRTAALMLGTLSSSSSETSLLLRNPSMLPGIMSNYISYHSRIIYYLKSPNLCKRYLLSLSTRIKSKTTIYILGSFVWLHFLIKLLAFLCYLDNIKTVVKMKTFYYHCM